MHELILRDPEGYEVGRMPLRPDERYAVYQCFQDGDLFTFGQRRYRLKSVAWRKPEGDLIVLGVYDSAVEPTYLDE